VGDVLHAPVDRCAVLELVVRRALTTKASRSMGFLGGRLVRSVRVRARAPQHPRTGPIHRRGDRVHSLCVRDSTRVDQDHPHDDSDRPHVAYPRLRGASHHGPSGAYVTTTSGPDFTVGMSSRRSLRGLTGEAVLGAITERISMPSMYCSTSAR